MFLAVTHRLLWIGIIENNQYQIWVRCSDVYAIKDIARRADGYSTEGRVDNRWQSGTLSALFIGSFIGSKAPLFNK